SRRWSGRGGAGRDRPLAEAEAVRRVRGPGPTSPSTSQPPPDALGRLDLSGVRLRDGPPRPAGRGVTVYGRQASLVRAGGRSPMTVKRVAGIFFLVDAVVIAIAGVW